jgi:hypothetical protein
MKKSYNMNKGEEEKSVSHSNLSEYKDEDHGSSDDNSDEDEEQDEEVDDSLQTKDLIVFHF